MKIAYPAFAAVRPYGTAAYLRGPLTSAWKQEMVYPSYPGIFHSRRSADGTGAAAARRAIIYPQSPTAVS